MPNNTPKKDNIPRALVKTWMWMLLNGPLPETKAKALERLERTFGTLRGAIDYMEQA
jgi:hypothetical protein